MDEDSKPDLSDVLEHYGAQIKFGKVSFMTRCVFHEDRTPSLSVNLDKGVWNCKSCGESGDSYTLIMKKEDTNFVGARAFAASVGFSEGSTGGGSDQLSGSAYGGKRTVPAKKGNRQGAGGYVPAWRRRS